MVDGRKVTYVRPTASVDKLAFTAGAVLRVQEGGRRLHPAPDAPLLPADRRAGRRTISSYFAGESDSEIGLKAGLGSDFWTAIQPDITGVQRHARAADLGFKRCVGGGPGAPPQCRAVAALMRAALANPRLRPAALAQIELLQAATAKQIAARLRRRRHRRRPSASSSTRSSPGCGSAA